MPLRRGKSSALNYLILIDVVSRRLKYMAGMGLPLPWSDYGIASAPP